MLNKVILQGRLCAEPELKQTAGGTDYVRLRLGCTRNFKNQKGEYESDFVNIIAWKGTAEFITKHFRKGDMIIVEGEIRTGSYEDRDGKKVYTTDIAAERVYFAAVAAKQDDSGYYPDEPPNVAASANSGSSQAAYAPPVSDDDYPF